MRKRLLILVGVVLAAAVTAGVLRLRAPAPPVRNDTAIVSAFLEANEKNPSYQFGSRPEPSRVLAATQMSLPEFLGACTRLLRRGVPAERMRAAGFLGRFGDPSATGALVGALDDREWEVRAAACYALAGLDAKGEAVEPPLVRLCRQDPSVAVRVAAAVALDGSHDEDTVAAYELGLRSRHQGLWDVCEDELEKRGRLQLPLPEHVYTDISPQSYHDFKTDPFYQVLHETIKDGTSYLEVVERLKDVPAYRHWYRVKLPPGGPKGPG